MTKSTASFKVCWSSRKSTTSLWAITIAWKRSTKMKQKLNLKIYFAEIKRREYMCLSMVNLLISVFNLGIYFGSFLDTMNLIAQHSDRRIIAGEHSNITIPCKPTSRIATIRLLKQTNMVKCSIHMDLSGFWKNISFKEKLIEVDAKGFDIYKGFHLNAVARSDGGDYICSPDGKNGSLKFHVDIKCIYFKLWIIWSIELCINHFLCFYSFYSHWCGTKSKYVIQNRRILCVFEYFN